jgi:hypothetical protein
MSGDALDELEAAVERLDFTIRSRRDLSHAEVVLDDIASALKPFWDLPKHLRAKATPLDEVLAYLWRDGIVDTSAAQAAANLLECAGRSSYGDEEDTFEEAEQNKGDLYDKLKALCEQLQEEEEEVEDG